MIVTRYEKMGNATRPGKPARTVENRKLVKLKPAKADRKAMSVDVVYTGNPTHKRYGGDFNLNPPAAARRNKTLCDSAGIFEKTRALPS